MPTLLQPRQTNVPCFGFRAKNAYAQGVQNGVDTAIVFDQVDYNTYGTGLYNIVAQSNRFTAPVAGRYLIFAGLTWTPGTGSRRYIRAQRNGGTILFQNELPPAAGCYVSHNASTVYQMAVGDYVEVFCYQDSPAWLNTFQAGGGYQTFGCEYLGP